MIPKMIHYCWFGGKPLPKDVLDCIKTWENIARITKSNDGMSQILM